MAERITPGIYPIIEPAELLSAFFVAAGTETQIAVTVEMPHDRDDAAATLGRLAVSNIREGLTDGDEETGIISMQFDCDIAEVDSNGDQVPAWAVFNLPLYTQKIVVPPVQQRVQ